jgi:chromosome segregation ATPase
VDLTTQSVKDTQIVLEDTLGIGQGLLQRCCFFGQHSHTQQSLLGLTDSKLKTELGALVDVTVWNSALSDVKSREKLATSRISELAIEIRVRNEELIRGKESVQRAKDAAAVAEVKVREARDRMKQVSGGSSSLQGGTYTEAELKSQLAALNSMRNDLIDNKLVPCRTKLVRITEDNSAKFSTVDSQLAVTKERQARNRFLEHSASAQSNAAAMKQKQLQVQLDSLTSKMNACKHQLNSFYPAATSHLDKTSLEEISGVVASLRAETDSKKASVAVAESKLQDSKTAFLKVRSVFEGLSLKKNDHHRHVLGESCPTCGQELDNVKLQERYNLLSKEVAEWSDRRSVALQEVSKISELLDAAQKLADFQKQLQQLSEKRRDVASELTTLSATLRQLQTDISSTETEVELAVAARHALNTTVSEQKQELIRTAERLENEVKIFDAKESGIRSDLEKVVRYTSNASAAQIQATAALNYEIEKLNATMAAAEIATGKKST